MNIELIIYLLLYLALRELVPAFYYYYTFRKQLLISIPKLLCILALAIACETVIVWQFYGQLSVKWIYLCPLLLFLPPELIVVKASMIKKMVLLVFIGLYMVLVQTLSFVVGAQSISGFTQLELLLLGLLGGTLFTMPFILHFLKQNAAILLQTKVKGILEMAYGIMLLNLGASIFIYNFESPRTWELFWGRFFITLPAFIFAHIIFYLLRQRELCDHLHVKQRYLERLRQEEKLHFEAIHASWQASRRLRHDTRHIALLLKEYAAQRDYQKIKQALATLRAKVLQS